MSKADMLHDRGKINDYMHGILMRSKDAMDMQLWDEAVQDAVEATMAGVNNDREYQIFHYIDTFVEDLAAEIFGKQLTTAQEADLKQYMFELREEIDYANLVSFWAAIAKWMSEYRNESLDKEAYPNHGVNGLKYMQRDNLVTWSKLATSVRKMLVQGVPENKALDQAAGLLHPRERLDFIAWYRFKFGHLTNLYDVNKVIRENEGKMKKKKSKFAAIHETGARYFLPDFTAPYMAMDEEVKEPEPAPEDVIDNEKRREDFLAARTKLVSRTFAIDKLLERYHDLIPEGALGDIEDALNLLRKKIRGLKCASTIRDTMIKTANIVKKKGFTPGAGHLEAMAYEFTGEGLVKVAFNGMNVAEITPILSELQTLSNQLKRRDLVRDIAKLDFKLHDMNASALFPELGEAQAKLIDATTYASNKLEDVIPKLRSVTQDTTAPEGVEVPLAKKEKKAPKVTAPKVPEPTAPAPTPAPEPTPAPAAAPAPTPTPAPAAPAAATPAPPLADFERAI